MQDINTQVQTNKANLEWHKDFLRRVWEFRITYVEDVPADREQAMEFEQLVKKSGERFGHLT